MASAFPRVYRSFEEFEQLELRKLDSLYESVDGLMDELLLSELEEGPDAEGDGILFELLDDDL